MLNRRVDAIDLDRRSAGPGLEWDALVLATGSRARRLPYPVPEGVHTLRTVADAEALGAELRPGARLAVIGAGFVGAEVASTARSLGVEVTLVDMAAVPLERVLGRGGRRDPRRPLRGSRGRPAARHRARAIPCRRTVA